MRGCSHWLNAHKWKHFELQQRREDRKYFQYVSNFFKARGNTGNHLQVLQPMWQTEWSIIVERLNGHGPLFNFWHVDSLTSTIVRAQFWVMTHVCMFSTTTGRSIRRVFPHHTPSSCSSASCPTHHLNLSISGRLPTKTTTLRSGSPSTVSHHVWALSSRGKLL